MTRKEELQELKKFIKERGVTKLPYIEAFPTRPTGRGRRKKTLKSINKDKVKK